MPGCRFSLPVLAVALLLVAPAVSAQNSVTIDQIGDLNRISGEQIGQDNRVRITQAGVGNLVEGLRSSPDRGVVERAFANEQPAVRALIQDALSGRMQSVGISQDGVGLSATITQSGTGNFAALQQNGSGHSFSLEQSGTNNISVGLQSGANQAATVRQLNGNNLAVTVQRGGQPVSVSQSGNATVGIFQEPGSPAVIVQQ